MVLIDHRDYIFDINIAEFFQCKLEISKIFNSIKLDPKKLKYYQKFKLKAEELLALLNLESFLPQLKEEYNYPTLV